VLFHGFDSGRQGSWSSQSVPEDNGGDKPAEAVNQAHWQHYWDSLGCSYRDCSGDLRSVATVRNFCSARQ
jgi:hypothetical protein